jgi:hypothetical protein
MPLADSIHDPRETGRTVCVSEKAIVRVYAICLSKHSLSNPALMIKRGSGLVLKESAQTTDVKHRRLGPRPRSGRRLLSDLSEHGFLCHKPPFLSRFRRTEQQHHEVLFSFIMLLYRAPLPLVLGIPLVHSSTTNSGVG